MEPFLIRLLITIGIIWLTEFLLRLFPVKEFAQQIILVVVVIIMVLFLVGYPLLPLR